MGCSVKIRPLRNDGFTLIEIMIVVAIIGLMAMLTIPSFLRARTASSGVRVANDLRVFGGAFAQYAMENGQYPPDSDVALPAGAGMETYLNARKWNETTAIGGTYNWEGPDVYPYAGVSVFNSSISDPELTLIDTIVDDGNLTSGHYRKTSNGRFTYIIEE